MSYKGPISKLFPWLGMVPQPQPVWLTNQTPCLKEIILLKRLSDVEKKHFQKLVKQDSDNTYYLVPYIAIVPRIYLNKSGSFTWWDFLDHLSR